MNEKPKNREELLIKSAQDSLRKLSPNIAGHTSKPNKFVTWGLTELVIEELLRITRTKDDNVGEELDQAINTVKSKILSSYESSDQNTNLEKCLSQVRETLKPNASSFSDKRIELEEAKQRADIYPVDEDIRISDTISASITTIGFIGLSVDRLHLNLEKYSLDLETVNEVLKKEYSSQSEWFPHLIDFENTKFIVDDDFSICAKADTNIIDNLKNRLITLARNLYGENT